MLGKLPAPRYAEYGDFRNIAGELIDSGLALYFPAPHSFTGEHVLELHGHGGAMVMDMLVKAALALGARLARPGEFSERAFLNGKIDLAQAEAIADLIDSASEQAARAALRSLQGEFSVCINSLVEQIIQLRMYVEAAIDFPEEEIDFLADTHIGTRLGAIIAEYETVLRRARQGSLLREGLNVVIAGRPNVGKSSLLNRLAGRDAAIVTAIPGTTRDVLCEAIHIDGLPLHIIDTAGLRESEEQIEQEGIRRAWHEIERADRVLLVVDDSERLTADEQQDLMQKLPANVAVTVVHNKIDLSGHAPMAKLNSPLLPHGASLLREEVQGAPPCAPVRQFPPHPLLPNPPSAPLLQRGEPTLRGGESNLHYAEIWLSAKSGAGMELLRHHLSESAGYQTSEGIFTARARHLDALARAGAALEKASYQLHEQRAGELLAEELRQAQHALAEITGAFTSEDLLGRIFSSFCIGK